MNNKTYNMYVKGTLLKGINIDIARVLASASVWFRSNERPRRNGISGFRLSFLAIYSETARKLLLRMASISRAFKAF